MYKDISLNHYGTQQMTDFCIFFSEKPSLLSAYLMIDNVNRCPRWCLVIRENKVTVVILQCIQKTQI